VLQCLIFGASANVTVLCAETKRSRGRVLCCLTGKLFGVLLGMNRIDQSFRISTTDAQYTLHHQRCHNQCPSTDTQWNLQRYKSSNNCTNAVLLRRWIQQSWGKGESGSRREGAKYGKVGWMRACWLLVGSLGINWGDCFWRIDCLLGLWAKIESASYFSPAASYFSLLLLVSCFSPASWYFSLTAIMFSQIVQTWLARARIKETKKIRPPSTYSAHLAKDDVPHRSCTDDPSIWSTQPAKSS